jgi:hypothetical protein
MRLEGLGVLKNPITLSGIEPATFLLVVFEILIAVEIHIMVFCPIDFYRFGGTYCLYSLA